MMSETRNNQQIIMLHLLVFHPYTGKIPLINRVNIFFLYAQQ